jgi:hypothetical protein
MSNYSETSHVIDLEIDQNMSKNGLFCFMRCLAIARHDKKEVLF